MYENIKKSEKNDSLSSEKFYPMFDLVFYRKLCCALHNILTTTTFQFMNTHQTIELKKYNQESSYQEYISHLNYKDNEMIHYLMSYFFYFNVGDLLIKKLGHFNNNFHHESWIF